MICAWGSYYYVLDLDHEIFPSVEPKLNARVDERGNIVLNPIHYLLNLTQRQPSVTSLQNNIPKTNRCIQLATVLLIVSYLTFIRCGRVGPAREG